MDTTTIIIGGIVSLVVSFLSGLAITRVNKQSDKIDELTKQQAQLQQVAVSESHVRKIIKEEMAPMSSTLDSIATTVRNIEIAIAEEKGYKAAIATVDRRRLAETKE